MSNPDPLTPWAAGPAPGGPPLCRADPDDCPNGPGPHAYYNPPEFDGRMCCCRQPGEHPAEWTVEGVVLCPGECGLYFDFSGTPQDLQEFIERHDCAFAQTGEKPR